MSEAIKTKYDNSSDWDVLQHNNEEEAKEHAKTLCEIQLQFTNKIINLRAKKEKMSEKEFLKWEDEYSDEYKKMMKEVLGKETTVFKAANYIHGMVAFPGLGREKELENTIEAQAGNYFYERKIALENTINSSDISEQEKTEKVDLIDNFINKAYEHIYFKFMEPEAVRDYGYQEYEASRVRTHNETIKSLNAINDLAKEYNMRPFTARNFWPSDAVTKERQSSAQAEMFRYDRDIVEEYYGIAFPGVVEKAKRGK